MRDDRPLSETVENRLMGQGIYLESWARRKGTRTREPDDRSREPDGTPSETDESAADASEPTVVLEYETVADAPTVTSDEVGTVVRTLLDAVEERGGWEPATLEATSYATDGEERGTWRVERDWFRRLHDDLTEVEFSSRVLDTIRTDRPDDRR